MTFDRSGLARDEIYRLSFFVGSREIDFRSRLSPTSLCYFLQDIASCHAASAGVDIADLLKIGKTWMLSRLNLIVNNLPRWKDYLDLFTWPVGVKSLFATRDFVALDKSGNTVAVATSSWLIVDLKSRKPVRVNRYIERMKLLNELRALDKYLIRPDYNLEGMNWVKPHREKVGLDDIDVNGHFTSMKYIEKILFNIDEDFRQDNELKEIEIYYMSEVLKGEELTYEYAFTERSSRNEGDFNKNRSLIHRVIGYDNRLVSLARTSWINLK